MVKTFGADRHIIKDENIWNPWIFKDSRLLICVEIKEHDIDGEVIKDWVEWWPRNNTPLPAEFISRPNREVVKLKFFDNKEEAKEIAKITYDS